MGRYNSEYCQSNIPFSALELQTFCGIRMGFRIFRYLNYSNLDPQAEKQSWLKMIFLHISDIFKIHFQVNLMVALSMRWILPTSQGVPST